MKFQVAATLPCNVGCHPCARASLERFGHGSPNFPRISSTKSISLHNLLRSVPATSGGRAVVVNNIAKAAAGCGGLETLELIQSGVLGEHPDATVLREVADLGVDRLVAAAARIRDRREDGDIVTFSPKVFIPLTRVCRDFCGYCTFSAPPRPGKPVYMSVDEVRGLRLEVRNRIADEGVDANCLHLFTFLQAVVATMLRMRLFSGCRFITA